MSLNSKNDFDVQDWGPVPTSTAGQWAGSGASSGNPFDTSAPAYGQPNTYQPQTTSSQTSFQNNNANNGPINSLHEPVSATVKRDLLMVWTKILVVLLPRDKNPETTIQQLRDWDLWGPLVICLLLSVTLSITAPSGQAALVFTAVFVIVWCGSAILTLNAVLLGAKISFFQSISLIGYCLFPLTVAALVIVIVPWQNNIFHLVLLVIGYIWSTRASVVFIAGCITIKRRALAVYPVFLFYIMIAWMIMLQ